MSLETIYIIYSNLELYCLWGSQKHMDELKQSKFNILHKKGSDHVRIKSRHMIGFNPGP